MKKKNGVTLITLGIIVVVLAILTTISVTIAISPKEGIIPTSQKVVNNANYIEFKEAAKNEVATYALQNSQYSSSEYINQLNAFLAKYKSIHNNDKILNQIRGFQNVQNQGIYVTFNDGTRDLLVTKDAMFGGRDQDYRE